MVDILLATYNGERYISEQIDSILNQDYTEWQLFVRDDESTDKTIEIINKYVEKYSDKVKLINDKKGNIGVRVNFGELLKYSKSQYCMFCDQDDVWLPNKISITLDKMKKIEKDSEEESPILVHTDLKVVDEKLNIIHDSIWEYMKLDPNRNTLNKLLVKATVTGCTMMINSNLRERIYGIPSNCLMHDYWITLIASSCGKIGILNQSTALYRQHMNNQVGAGERGILKKIINSLKERTYKLNINDAESLYYFYHNQMSKENKKMLKEFISIEKSGFLKRRYILIKNRQLTNNIFRNIQIFLFC